MKENLPIAGTSFHAADAADKDSPCPWDEGNWGVADNAAGQAYYDSMLKLYAGWGLDYIKVDCISDHPYRPTEIQADCRGDQEDGAADCAEPFAGADAAGARGRGGRIRADVAHHRRPLGWLDVATQAR